NDAAHESVLSGFSVAHLVYFAGLAIVVAACLWLYEVRQQRSALEALATLHATELDAQLVRLAELPTVLSEDPRLIAALRGARPDAIAQANTLLRRVQQQTDIEHAFLMDTSGLTIASSNHAVANSFVGKNYGFRPYFSTALSGRRGTQYAVGATTGQPGYFVSQPVSDRSVVAGVLVFKLSLDHLADIWSARDESTVLIDDVGIVILSSIADLLYKSTRPLSDEQALSIRQVRHYPISASDIPNIAWSGREARWREFDYLTASASLDTETWQVGVMRPQRDVATAVIGNFVSVMAILSVLLLLLRDWWRQRQLARIEHQNARSLSNQVEEKTQALERAQRSLIEHSNLAALGRMSSAINHEVNQPLASLKLNLASLNQLVDRNDIDRSELQTTVADCERTTRRISQVVAALRTLARPGDTRFKPIAVDTLVDEVIDTLAQDNPGIRAYLQRAQIDGDAVLQGNPVLLQQALLNLLHNAGKAVAHVDDPMSWISATSGPSQIDIAITDNGPGVGAELSDTLFEPFVHSSDNERGLGLGLALARQIASYHHGRLSHERTRENTTRFSLSLPLEPPSST
ncbi:MAG: ATP-binding protein, partial [Pseudomonadota bacterium]